MSRHDGVHNRRVGDDEANQNPEGSLKGLTRMVTVKGSASDAERRATLHGTAELLFKHQQGMIGLTVQPISCTRRIRMHFSYP